MKLTAAIVLASTCLAVSPVIAQDDDFPTDTPATHAAEAWMKAMLAPGGSVAAPSKDKPLDYLVSNGTKSCKTMKAGTAKDFKALAKLQKCVVDSYKAIGQAGTTQFMQLPSAATVMAVFPKSQWKRIKAAAKDATIVESHYVGDGLNMDAYLALDADNHVKAIWLTEEGFE